MVSSCDCEIFHCHNMNFKSLVHLVKFQDEVYCADVRHFTTNVINPQSEQVFAQTNVELGGSLAHIQLLYVKLQPSSGVNIILDEHMED